LGRKVVKLNRRFKLYKEHGHTVALRFDGWDGTAIKYEQAARSKLGGHGYSYKDAWVSHFGARNKDPRPYWIAFRREADLTLVLLSADLTK
jgi:hypothetical protein